MSTETLLKAIKESASEFYGTVDYTESTLTITSPLLDEPHVYEVVNDTDLVLIDYIISSDSYI